MSLYIHQSHKTHCSKRELHYKLQILVSNNVYYWLIDWSRYTTLRQGLTAGEIVVYICVWVHVCVCAHKLVLSTQYIYKSKTTIKMGLINSKMGLEIREFLKVESNHIFLNLTNINRECLCTMHDVNYWRKSKNKIDTFNTFIILKRLATLNTSFESNLSILIMYKRMWCQEF